MRAVSFARCLGTNAVVSGFFFFGLFFFFFSLPDAFLSALRNLTVPRNYA